MKIGQNVRQILIVVRPCRRPGPDDFDLLRKCCGQALGTTTLIFSEMLGLHPNARKCLWSGPGHDDFDLFGNARITSDRSEISAVACKHSKPITWRVLAPNYQT